jgi:hypothetical protein
VTVPQETAGSFAWHMNRFLHSSLASGLRATTDFRVSSKDLAELEKLSDYVPKKRTNGLSDIAIKPEIK